MHKEAQENGPPFEFRQASVLVEATRLRASSLSQLLSGVTLAPRLSIFYHLHQHFFSNPNALPEYPNDFARWTSLFLGENVVAERLSNLNVSRTADFEDVRREISVILAQRLANMTEHRHASSHDAFVFCEPRLTICSNGAVARSPDELLRLLRRIDIGSVGYHIFLAPRLGAGPATNDFATWFRRRGFHRLGRRLASFDPHLMTLEESRQYLAGVIDESLKAETEAERE